MMTAERLVLVAWYAAVSFTAWALWTHGHPAWACVAALVGVLMTATEAHISR